MCFFLDHVLLPQLGCFVRFRLVEVPAVAPVVSPAALYLLLVLGLVHFPRLPKSGKACSLPKSGKVCSVVAVLRAVLGISCVSTTIGVGSLARC